jgi:hypothetical protein
MGTPVLVLADGIACAVVFWFDRRQTEGCCSAVRGTAASGVACYRGLPEANTCGSSAYQRPVAANRAEAVYKPLLSVYTLIYYCVKTRP